MNLEDLKKQVNTKLELCRLTIIDKLGEDVGIPEVRYDLKGTVAGQAAVSGKYIRLHPIFLEHYKDEYIDDTVVHEYAHIVQTILYPETTYQAKGRMQIHGAVWKRIMRILGADPTRLHTYSRSVLNDKLGKYRLYMCTCCNKEFHLSAVRHNKVMRGTMTYSHAECKSPIIFVGP